MSACLTITHRPITHASTKQRQDQNTDFPVPTHQQIEYLRTLMRARNEDEMDEYSLLAMMEGDEGEDGSGYTDDSGMGDGTTPNKNMDTPSTAPISPAACPGT